jgi:anti-anti-sigma factor
MPLETRKKDGLTIVSIAGRMDAVTTGEIESALMGLVEKGETRLLFDLGALEYVSSAGLRTFLVTAKRLKAQGGEMAFANLGGHVKDVFDMSGFCTMFKVFDSTEAAMEHF